jgi:hypothetical protein
MMNTADVIGGKPIAVLLQSISGVNAINPLVAFYDIHGGKREVLFFYFVPDTTRDYKIYNYSVMTRYALEFGRGKSAIFFMIFYVYVTTLFPCKRPQLYVDVE